MTTRACEHPLHFRLGWTLLPPLLPLAAAFALFCGCVQSPSGQNKPEKPTPGRVVDARSLEQIAFESFQQRDRLRAEKLRKLKGLKYDVARQDAIAEAGAEASEESWAPVREALSKRLDGIPQTDQAAFDKVLDELAAGAERAGR